MIAVETLLHSLRLEPDHVCQARIYADCPCGTRVVWCLASRADVQAITARTYRCAACREQAS